MKKTLLFTLALIAVGCGPPYGPYELYYDNGQLREKGTYVAGELDGPYVRYDENGQLERKGTLKTGEKCGEWIEDGEVVTYDPCPPGGN